MIILRLRIPLEMRETVDVLRHRRNKHVIFVYYILNRQPGQQRKVNIRLIYWDMPYDIISDQTHDDKLCACYSNGKIV